MSGSSRGESRPQPAGRNFRPTEAEAVPGEGSLRQERRLRQPLVVAARERPPSRPISSIAKALSASPAAVSRVPATSPAPRSAKAASTPPHDLSPRPPKASPRAIASVSGTRPSIVAPRPPAASPNVRAHALAPCGLAGFVSVGAPTGQNLTWCPTRNVAKWRSAICGAPREGPECSDSRHFVAMTNWASTRMRTSCEAWTGKRN